MRMRQHSVSLALAAGIWASTTLSMAETAPGVDPAMAEVAPREPILGIGYHPGNFVGPLAFEVILRALPHIAGDVQMGGIRLGINRAVVTLQEGIVGRERLGHGTVLSGNAVYLTHAINTHCSPQEDSGDVFGIRAQTPQEI